MKPHLSVHSSPDLASAAKEPSCFPDHPGMFLSLAPHGGLVLSGAEFQINKFLADEDGEKELCLPVVIEKVLECPVVDRVGNPDDLTGHRVSPACDRRTANAQAGLLSKGFVICRQVPVGSTGKMPEAVILQRVS